MSLASYLTTGLGNPKFTIFKASDGKFYWNFKAGNGEKLCHSEGYNSQQAAVNGIRSLKENIGSATIADLT